MLTGVLAQSALASSAVVPHPHSSSTRKVASGPGPSPTPTATVHLPTARSWLAPPPVATPACLSTHSLLWEASLALSDGPWWGAKTGNRAVAGGGKDRGV